MNQNCTLVKHFTLGLLCEIEFLLRFYIVRFYSIPLAACRMQLFDQALSENEVLSVGVPVFKMVMAIMSHQEGVALSSSVITVCVL